MATILDIGLIQSFDFIFPVVLVWAFMFAILQKTKVIGDSLGINALIASMAAFMVLLSRTVIDLINFMIPWFTIAIIFFLLMLLLFMVFGAKGTEAYQDKTIQWILVGVGILIVVAAAGKVMGQSLLEQSAQAGEVPAGDGEVSSQNFEQNIFATLFNPKVLGLIVMFGIVIFTVALLSG
ncbi:MAG: hypothetical protein ABH824_02970 [Nanoarchaeota archaeon]|nr:hypothetical protein [Patescibacteria group bacterium]MBU1875550.1 hypothetical protein [Nanoarchaeota archaeon]